MKWDHEKHFTPPVNNVSVLFCIFNNWVLYPAKQENASLWTLLGHVFPRQIGNTEKATNITI